MLTFERTACDVRKKALTQSSQYVCSQLDRRATNITNRNTRCLMSRGANRSIESSISCARHPPLNKEHKLSAPIPRAGGSKVGFNAKLKDTARIASSTWRGREAMQEERKGTGRQINKDNAQFMKTRR